MVQSSSENTGHSVLIVRESSALMKTRAEIKRRIDIVLAALNAKLHSEEKEQKIHELKAQLERAEDSALKKLAQEVLDAASQN